MEEGLRIMFGKLEDARERCAEMTVDGRTVPVRVLRVDGITHLRLVSFAGPDEDLCQVESFLQKHARRGTGHRNCYNVSGKRATCPRMRAGAPLRH